MGRVQANDLLRAARERLPSPSGAPRSMSRQELAEAVNAYLWNAYHIKENLDQNDIGKLENGWVRWPRKWRRVGLRAVLRAENDAELGLYFYRANEHPHAESPAGAGASRSRTTEPVSPQVIGRLDVGSLSEGAISANQSRWRDVRQYLNRRRTVLAGQAVGLYPDELRVGPTSLITRQGWLPGHPVDLDRVELGWRAGFAQARVRGDEPEVGPVLPLMAPGKQYDRYTSAVRYVDPPSLFENRPSYRLLDLAWHDDAGRMTFGLATYFDKLDICEAVGHEYAAAAASLNGATPGWEQLPLRALIGDDPFDLVSRIVVPAVTTLTIRVDHGRSAFLLHWRDPAKVATAGGMYDAIPAGEFQPSSLGMWDQVNDFDLWRNIVREFSEELLGAPEHDGSRSAPIDYHRWPLYQQMQAARRNGQMSVACLGVGLDALTLAATIMTVVVIDGPTFDNIFGQIVRVNAEGQTVAASEGRQAAEGLPFTEDVVTRMVQTEPIASPGAACLHLAWAHRRQLLGAVSTQGAGTVGSVMSGSTNTQVADQGDGPVTPAVWRAIRSFQRERRGELAREAAMLYPDSPRVGNTVLLTRPGWLPSEPVPLEAVTRQPVGDIDSRVGFSDTAKAAAYLQPQVDAGGRIATYAEALAAIDRPRLLQNRPTYRLVAAALTGDSPSLSFGAGTYFDVLNVGEAAAHEYAAAYRTGRRPRLVSLPLRSHIGDPTDPNRRPMLAAITTLTIRHDQRTGDAQFLVHWRDPAKVATNGGAYQLAPVGVFQPAGEAGERWMVDLDPWRCMVREYSEELLGTPEIDSIAYELWPFYLDLEQAREQGTCRPYLLGIGVDPLTLATDLLTVVVFEAEVFDRLFSELVADNSEGRFLRHGGDGLIGVSFDDDEVQRLVGLADMQPAGAATLEIAWRHRQLLLHN